MNVPFLDVRRQALFEREGLERAFREFLESGTYVFGDELEAFEREFAEWCGVGFAVGVASGTDAVELALRACGVRAGDEVIAPANTCVPTIAAIVAAGAVPVLADVDAETFTIDPKSVESVLSKRTGGIVAVHLYGQSADMVALEEIGEAHGIPVIEDAAQAHGAELRGRRVGGFGKAAAFSFYPTKNLGALGDAGAVTTDDPDVALEVKRFRNYGEDGRYNSVRNGRNSRLDSLQARILRERLARLDERNARRRVIAARYQRDLAECGLILPGEGSDRVHAFHLYVVQSERRDSVREDLGAAGVGTLVHYPRPIHRHPAYLSLRREGGLRTCERLADRVLSLPLFPEMHDREVERVVEAVHKCAGR